MLFGMSEKVPGANSENIESVEAMTPKYTALFVKDSQVLLEKFPPRHQKVYGHHSTIQYKPTSLDDLDLGAETKMRIIGRAFDENGDALLVENPKSYNTYPHITLSCAEGVPPNYSNELIGKAVAENTVEYFSVPEEIDVIEGYSDGKDAVLTPEQ